MLKTAVIMTGAVLCCVSLVSARPQAGRGARLRAGQCVVAQTASQPAVELPGDTVSTEPQPRRLHLRQRDGSCRSAQLQGTQAAPTDENQRPCHFRARSRAQDGSGPSAAQPDAIHRCARRNCTGGGMQHRFGQSRE